MKSNGTRKRQCDDSEEDETPKRKCTSPPINFLSLPCELGQQKLLESFRDPLANDMNFSTNCTILKLLLGLGAQFTTTEYAPHVAAWGSILGSIYLIIERDLEFVLSQILTELESTEETINRTKACKSIDCPSRWDDMVWGSVEGGLDDGFKEPRHGRNMGNMIRCAMKISWLE